MLILKIIITAIVLIAIIKLSLLIMLVKKIAKLFPHR